MSKTEAEHFIDWESNTFGFGYGSGEEFIIPVLRRFLELCNKYGDKNTPGRAYDHEELEAELGGPVAWLLINALCRVDIIEYGTSPRCGWLTSMGERLKAYMLGKSVDELFGVFEARPDDYFYCSPESCNCGLNGHREGVKCLNPFWVDR